MHDYVIHQLVRSRHEELRRRTRDPYSVDRASAATRPGWARRRRTR